MIETYLKNYKLLLYYAMRILNNQELAEQAVQTVYIRMIKRPLPTGSLPELLMLNKNTAWAIKNRKYNMDISIDTITEVQDPKDMLEEIMTKQSANLMIKKIEKLKGKTQEAIIDYILGNKPRHHTGYITLARKRLNEKTR